MNSNQPAWMVRVEGNNTPVAFEQIYPKSQKVALEATFVFWDYNSYGVDVKGQFFVINGGRKIQFPRKHVVEPRLLCARRVLTQVVESGTRKQITYLLGYCGTSIEGEPTELFLKISEDGSTWEWGDKR